jgi:hypothetical protein
MTKGRKLIEGMRGTVQVDTECGPTRGRKKSMGLRV